VITIKILRAIKTYLNKEFNKLYNYKCKGNKDKCFLMYTDQYVMEHFNKDLIEMFNLEHTDISNHLAAFIQANSMRKLIEKDFKNENGDAGQPEDQMSAEGMKGNGGRTKE
jgi:hypothetical protein